MTLKVIAEKVPNLPWEERPAECRMLSGDIQKIRLSRATCSQNQTVSSIAQSSPTKVSSWVFFEQTTLAG